MGHQVDLAGLRSDLHLLLAVFLASQPIAAIGDFDRWRGEDLYKLQDCEGNAITRLLLSTSISLRVLDDQEQRALDYASIYCGRLTRDITKPVESNIGLTLREACNKIIHASVVEFDRGALPSGSPYLHPFLYLKGSERSTAWEVQLDVVQFVREGINAILSLQAVA